MERFSDVIVIGGGPCGSFSALNLSKKDLDVTVFEEHSQIGVPCHCAGHISINGLKNLGLYPLPKGIIENEFVGAKFYSPNCTKFTVRLAKPVTCVVNRSLFDNYIAGLAQKAGVHYNLNTRVESPLFENGWAKGVVVKRRDKAFDFSAKIVLDAEGISARMLKHASLPIPRSDMIVKGVQAEVDGVNDIEPDIVEVILGSSYAPGFYAWLIPKNEAKAKIGLAAKTGNPKMLLQRLVRRHPAVSAKLRGAKIVKESYHPITLGGPISKAYSNGFLVVGDAASQVKPTTGGGVIFGLNCAKIASDVIVEALDKNDLSAEFLSAYQERFMKLFGFDLKFMLKVREMLNKFSDKGLDDLISFCGKLHLNRVFKDLKEIDFQGRTILKFAQNPKALTALAYFFLSYLLGKP